MNTMNIPGFTAHMAISSPNTHGRVVGALLPRDAETPQDRRLDCLVDCLESGQSTQTCADKCRPITLPPYVCTVQDDSVNYYLCLGGIKAWELVCSAECGLLGGIAVAGPALAAACGWGCTQLADQMRLSCHPTRCV